MLLAVLVSAFGSCHDLHAQKSKPPDPTPKPVVRYQMTLLGTLGGPSSNVVDMNSLGDVVGMSKTAETFVVNGETLYRWRPFVNLATTGSRLMIDLQAYADRVDVEKFPPAGIDGVAPWVRWELSAVTGMNDVGQITGRGYLYDDAGVRSAEIVWRLTLVGADGFGSLEYCGSAPGGSSIVPVRINNQGDIAGRAFIGGVWTAFLYTDEHGLLNLGTLNGSETKACGLTSRVNNVVRIAGSAASDQKGWQMQATINPGGITVTAMQDIGSLYSRSPQTSATGMNELGQIVGCTRVSRDASRACRYTPGTGFRNLGTLSATSTWATSTANAVNILGDVVGNSHAGTSTLQPTLYRDDLGLVNLASLIQNFDIVKAQIGTQDFFNYALNPTEINDAGQICGPLDESQRYTTGQAWILDLVK